MRPLVELELLTASHNAVPINLRMTLSEWSEQKYNGSNNNQEKEKLGMPMPHRESAVRQRLTRLQSSMN
jgi:hypothetical protein